MSPYSLRHGLDREFDVAIVGGGLAGLSVARDCAMRRLSVVLFEEEDFGATSAAAESGILSGAPQKLREDPVATRRACQEAAAWLRIAPNLVTRVPTLYPVLDSAPAFALERIESFARAYERYSVLKDGKPTIRLSRDEALSVEPGLSHRIRGAVSSDEWVIDVQRLIALTAKSAAAAGALLLKKFKAVSVESHRGTVLGVKVTSAATGDEPIFVRSQTVVNACGASFLEMAKQHPHRGLKTSVRWHSYLAFERRILNVAIACPAENSLDRVFLFPRNNLALLGPSETEATDERNNSSRAFEETRYLVETARRYFPEIENYRPSAFYTAKRNRLISEKTADQQIQNGIYVDHSEFGAFGFFTLLTSSATQKRRFSEVLTDELCKFVRKRERCRTHLESLPGCTSEIPWREESRRTKRPPLLVKRLIVRQGYNAREILDQASQDPVLGTTLCECEQILAAEVEHCVKHEWVQTLEDLRRRIRWGEGTCQGCKCTAPTAQFMGTLLNWSSEEILAQQTVFWKAQAQRTGCLFGASLKQREYGGWIQSSATLTDRGST